MLATWSRDVRQELQRQRLRVQLYQGVDELAMPVTASHAATAHSPAPVSAATHATAAHAAATHATTAHSPSTAASVAAAHAAAALAAALARPADQLPEQRRVCDGRGGDQRQRCVHHRRGSHQHRHK